MFFGETKEEEKTQLAQTSTTSKADESYLGVARNAGVNAMTERNDQKNSR